jgi:general secretion pathway protein A
MYENFYGFSVKPFSLLPDAGFLFLSRRHRRALNLLEYGVMTEAGFVVISGEVGAGKTTIVRRFLRNAGLDVAVGVITNPSASLGNLLGWIAAAFELKESSGDGAKLYNAFLDFLLAQYAKGRRTILIIDEAQNLTAEMLEELRMLSNVNNERDLLLQIVLVGQPELLDTLKRPDLRQFVQRISVHFHLTPLEPAETAAYIRHRLSVAGGNPALFDDEACAAVHHFTGGVPRLINLLCDQSLVYGYSENMPRIPFKTVAEVVIDRGKSGLSAFLNVPETAHTLKLANDIEDMLRKIRTPEQEGAASL